MAELTKGEPLHRMGDVRISLTIVFYLERGREEALYQAESMTDGFYICYAEDFPEIGTYEVLKEFAYWGEPIFLISFN